MSKYIDAEDIASTIRKVRTKFAIDSVFGENMREDAAVAGALEAVAQVIDILPAADVVEVVRCKECKYWNRDALCCTKEIHYIVNAEENDYCSYGERKDG